MKEKIVITGGAGFIGSQLGYKLDKEGYEVILLDDMSFGYEDNLRINNETFGQFTKFDIRSTELKSFFENAQCVFHLAAISALPVCQSDPQRAMEVNLAGTGNVLEAARLSDVSRVVFASSGAVYENNTKFPCSEDDPVLPNLVYPLSKWYSENLCKSFHELYGMEISITRYNNVYGPHQDVKRKAPPFVGYVIRELLANQTPILHSDGTQRRDYVYIDDVNELNILCMTHPNAPGEIFNVASGIDYSVNEMYTLIARILNSDTTPIFRESTKFWDKYTSLFKGKYPLNEKRIAKEVEKFTLCSTKKANELIGWKTTTTIEEGLTKTINYAKKILS